MDESMLEREIEGLLAVDPASDFRARVRQRIAQEPALDVRRPLWRPLWVFAATGAVSAIAVAIVIALLRVDPAPTTTRELEARAIDRSMYVAAAPSVVAPSIARTNRSRPRTRTSAVPRMEVIVQSSEAAAWRRLLAGISTGDVELSFPAQADVATSRPSSEDFVLPPIVIEPLALSLPEEGVHP
jgi:hypothetical protein